MPELVRPTTELQAAFREAAWEFESASEYQHGSGLAPPSRPDLDWHLATLDEPGQFAAFVAYVRGLADDAFARSHARVPDDKFWIVQEGAVLGFLSVRRELNAQLLEEGGHVGYSVRPTARRRGLATWALGQGLDHLADLGVDRALVTCDDTNTPSARTIEHHGGVLEDVRSGKRRYWISLADGRPPRGG